MSRLKSFSLLAALTFALLACAPAAQSFRIATLQNGTFHHVTYDYSVVVQPTGRLMSEDWRLDNYAPSPTSTGLGRPKVTDPYVSTMGLDDDGDGDYEVQVRIPTYDLLFKHRRDDGVIFLSTFPVSQHAGDRELSIMLRDFVESAALSGQITHKHGDRTVRTSSPMASRILASRPVMVRGFPAHEVIFEVANVQQLELTPSARWERGHVVVVRAEMVFNREQSQRSLRVPGAHRRIESTTFYPVLMVIGYSNHPDEFDSHYDDFQEFLGRIHIGDVWSTAAIEAVRDGCRLNQLDVVISDGQVIRSSIPQRTQALRCAEDGLVAARFPEAGWMRTFSVRAHSLRDASGATTAGQPLERAARPTPVTAPTTGRPSTADSPNVIPDTRHSTGAAPTGI